MIKTNRYEDKMSEDVSAIIWQEMFSKTHNAKYYYNKKDGSKVWKAPTTGTIIPMAQQSSSSDAQSSKKRPRIEIVSKAIDDNDKKSKATLTATANAVPIVAIIVPFRDNADQNRKQHLDQFIPEMTAFLMKSSTTFRIYIIEQSSDDRKFNRGKLLNIGFDVASKDGCEIFIFHDVDLVPSAELLDYYTCKPKDNSPIHIAKIWDRYNANGNYFGGIVSFTSEQYKKINGYPNNFWGWGGEDDELHSRVVTCSMSIDFPPIGSITDLEKMTLHDKLGTLWENRVWKCMNKTEVLDEHATTWQANGLNNLKYSELYRSWLNDNSLVVHVDVELNQHWTDLVCQSNSRQMEESAAVLKARFEQP